MERLEHQAKPRRRELARRMSAGLEVVLYWCARRASVTLSVHDARTGEAFEVEVDAADALDAFRHPYAYAWARRTPTLVDV